MDAGPEILQRFWTDMIARTEGPMTFRFYLQPTMALIAALIDGIKDAKTGRTPYFRRVVHTDMVGKKAAFKEALKATTRILVLGAAMDIIYQFKVYGAFKYLMETVVIVIVLAFLPYALLRGPIDRIARRFLNKPR